MFDCSAPGDAIQPAVFQRTWTWLPPDLTFAPVVRHGACTNVNRRLALSTFDHRDLVRLTPNKCEEHGAGELDGLEQLHSLREPRSRLENMAQKV